MAHRKNLPSLVEKIFLLGIFLRFTISNSLLNTIINYTSPGGSEIFKIHPGTYFILIAFYISLFTRQSMERLNGFRRHALVFLCIIASVAFLQVIKFGLNSVAYLLDTFIIAALAALFLERASSATACMVRRMLLAVVLINSLVAILEFSTHHNLLPGNEFNFSHFRAQAVFGHPLLNALLTGLTLIFVLSIQKINNKSVAYVIIGLIALLAFGGRAALVTFVLFSTISLLGNFGRRLMARRIRILELVTIPFVVMLIVGTAGYMIFFSAFGERFREMAGADNNSTVARLNIWSIYSPLRYDEITWGISPELKQMLIEQNPYFSTIENFWIDISLSLGSVLFIIFALGFISFVIACARDQRVSLMMPLFFFLAVASTNNALSVKSPALLFFVVLMVSARKSAQTSYLTGRRISHALENTRPHYIEVTRAASHKEPECARH